MAQGGDLLARRVYERVRQRLTPEQCVPYLNLGVSYITLLCSCPWDAATALAQNPTSDIVTLAGLDIGKKIACFNATLKTPIMRASQDEIATKSMGFINTMPSQYNSYRLAVSVTNVPTLEFFPHYSPTLVAVDIYYHLTPVVLTNASTPTTRWQIPALDDLLVDYAEGEIKRQFGAPDAAELLSRSEERIQRLITATYSDEKINTGPAAESAAARKEKSEMGAV